MTFVLMFYTFLIFFSPKKISFTRFSYSFLKSKLIYEVYISFILARHAVSLFPIVFIQCFFWMKKINLCCLHFFLKFWRHTWHMVTECHRISFDMLLQNKPITCHFRKKTIKKGQTISMLITFIFYLHNVYSSMYFG